ncbi:MAG: hypothetical protein UT32_C0009G0025 [Parcubacteria group bacterium GW2011_GWC2_39_14]|nr:MAG: hypothetical protein UT32_C0009G0025 [Parcubacteria group bacterium GW2011_GWC2_39_14]KKR55364.1 MAG: hypothetical protein UT91_C0002G0025 [Parcubacteria group bacterium GW2011_GWA2_40_23]
MVTRDLRREVVGDPDSARAEQDRGADGRLVERLLGEEVLLDDAEPSDVAWLHPVEGGQRVVVPLHVPLVAVDREVDVALDAQEQVAWQGLREPDARESGHAAVVGHPETSQELEVRLRRQDAHLRPEVAEDHGVAAH